MGSRPKTYGVWCRNSSISSSHASNKHNKDIAPTERNVQEDEISKFSTIDSIGIRSFEQIDESSYPPNYHLKKHERHFGYAAENLLAIRNRFTVQKFRQNFSTYALFAAIYSFSYQKPPGKIGQKVS